MSDWKFETDEVGEDAEPDETPDLSLDPGSPSMENTFFVVLGVATTLFVFARIVLLLGG